MQLEHLAKYRATLRLRRDPKFGAVKKEMEQFDGVRFETRELWYIDCDEDEFARKTYHGEHAMETPRGWPIHWVASGDLTDIEPID